MENVATLAGEIAAILKERHETVAVAESSAGGLISAALLAVPGASAYYLGGVVVYTRQARRLLLDIQDVAMKDIRSSSEPYANLLASVVRQRFSATWGIGETGAAGPTGNSKGDAAGHTCVGVSGAVSLSLTLETGNADRVANMDAFTLAALQLLKKVITR